MNYYVLFQQTILTTHYGQRCLLNCTLVCFSLDKAPGLPYTLVRASMGHTPFNSNRLAARGVLLFFSYNFEGNSLSL